MSTEQNNRLGNRTVNRLHAGRKSCLPQGIISAALAAFLAGVLVVLVLCHLKSPGLGLVPRPKIRLARKPGTHRQDGGQAGTIVPSCEDRNELGQLLSPETNQTLAWRLLK